MIKFQEHVEVLNDIINNSDNDEVLEKYNLD